jgi:hypothetical protein
VSPPKKWPGPGREQISIFLPFAFTDMSSGAERGIESGSDSLTRHPLRYTFRELSKSSVAMMQMHMLWASNLLGCRRISPIRVRYMHHWHHLATAFMAFAIQIVSFIKDRWPIAAATFEMVQISDPFKVCLRSPVHSVGSCRLSMATARALI